MAESKDARSLAKLKRSLAYIHYNAENYEAALKCYSEAIDLCPDTAATNYNLRAACHWRLQDYSSALADARHAICLDSGCEAAHVQLAKCCRVLGDIRGLELAVQQVLQLNRENTAVDEERKALMEFRRLAPYIKTSYDRKLFGPTMVYLDFVLAIAPVSVEFLVLKAECLAHLDRCPDALEIAVRAMKLDPTSAEAIFVRGLCLYHMDNVESSILHFESALSLDPDHAKSKQLRTKARQLKQLREEGNRLFQMSRFREADLLYTEALTIDATNRRINSKLQYSRALVQARLGSFQQAVQDCSTALSLNGQFLPALVLRGQCHSMLELFPEAVRDFQKALVLEDSSKVQSLLRDASRALKLLNCYKILGVARNASHDVIKRAYHTKAKLHHPDMHLNDTVEQQQEEQLRFIEAVEAYEMLAEEKERQQGQQKNKQKDQQVTYTDLEEIFHSLFCNEDSPLSF